MRALRIARFVTVMAAHTARTARAVRRAAPEDRARVQAEGQRRGSQACLNAFGMRVRVEGAPLPDRAALVAPNHFSLLDAFVYSALLPLAMTGRADVHEWPGVGWVSRTMGLIGVDRARRTSTGDFVEDVQGRLAEGVSVLVFPEGTVSKGDALLPFKTGGFEAVAGSGLPVLPLYYQPVRAAGRPVTTLWDFCWHKEPVHRSLWRLAGLMPCEAVVRVGTLLPTEGATRKTLAVDAHAAVSALRAEVRTGAGLPV